MNEKSLEGLIDFLDYTAKKGLTPKNTAASRKAAVSKVFGVLDPEERGDVTALDLDDVMNRFFNLQGKDYKPDSLGVYRSRVGRAIEDYKRYLDDPAGFKPGRQLKKLKPTATRSEAPTNKTKRARDAESLRQEQVHQPVTASANVFPIPIRPNVVVRINGLPFDLSPAEAEKIANVVKAMAMVPE